MDSYYTNEQFQYYYKVSLYDDTEWKADLINNQK